MDKQIPQIETDRLLLKQVDEEHCTSRYLSWLADEDVNLYLEAYALSKTIEDLKNYVLSLKASGTLFWAIHLKDSNDHIGNIKIDPVNQYHGFAEYGILMGDKSNWGKGYAKEASNAVVDFCFNELNLRKVVLGVVEDNTAAVKLYESMGFKVEGTYVDHGHYGGKLCNILRMAKFNDNFSHE